MGIGLRLHYTGGGGGGDDDYVPPPRPPSNDPDRDPCAFEIETVLQSVDLDVLRPVQVGQSLKVEILFENGKERLCATLNGRVAGAVFSPFVTDLIDCIRKGNQYIAVVSEIIRNEYHVRVKRA